jgi:hypothetical protein
MTIDIRATEVNQQASTTKFVADKSFILLLKATSTPSVRAATVCKANGSDITDFMQGSEGQSIKVMGDGVATVAYNANIKNNTIDNTPKLLKANTVYTFTLINGIWYEDE